ncbi:MAG: cytidine deaminase [Bacteroidales bacterium]|nr:cytidine deaminase [Bacteroidales bacterium]
MKKEIIRFECAIAETIGELEADDQSLLNQAAEAAKNAWAPYSKFRVGAAVRLENGIIVTGNNQENPAYPSGLCAERVALFYASSQYPGVAVSAIAITATSSISPVTRPIPPCGACRQVMSDTENRFHKDMRVIMRGQQGPVMICDNMKSLLPLSFIDEYLPK